MIQNEGHVPEHDMRKTFNLGIGLIVIVSPLKVDQAIRLLIQQNEIPIVMGEVVEN